MRMIVERRSAKVALACEMKRIIEERCCDAKFDLTAIAGEMFVDKCYLVRAFHEVTGTTPLAYHNSCRCQRAEALLRRPELSIA